ncbi:MAG: hypothetical protein ACK526_02310 [Planctomyces sp.]
MSVWQSRLMCWMILLSSSQILNASENAARPKLRIGVATTVYYHNSHADVIASRLLHTNMLDGTGSEFGMELVSLYVDQYPSSDISRLLASSHRFHSAMTIPDSLTVGTDSLNVDGFLLIAEHGNYPRSASGNQQYPKKRFWDEMLKVFDSSGRVVPVFLDKHLSDNWAEAEYIYQSAKKRNIPLMAGSSVSGGWRFPPADVRRGAKLKQIVGLSFGATDAYGFHGLEALQALAEQREGGETGVVSVQCLSGEALWKAIDAGILDRELLNRALDRLPDYDHELPLDPASVRDPKLFIMQYRDGLQTFLLELNRHGRAGAWTAAWRYADDDSVESTQFWTQEARPAGHFGFLLQGVEEMMRSGKPTWPVERTLLTTGILDAAMQSLSTDGVRMETPWLNVNYQSEWRWKTPPPPPVCRPWGDQ